MDKPLLPRILQAQLSGRAGVPPEGARTIAGLGRACGTSREAATQWRKGWPKGTIPKSYHVGPMSIYLGLPRDLIQYAREYDEALRHKSQIDARNKTLTILPPPSAADQPTGEEMAAIDKLCGLIVSLLEAWQTDRNGIREDNAEIKRLLTQLLIELASRPRPHNEMHSFPLLPPPSN